jgi:predicted GNAT superfamily acetyltransferase
VVAHKIGGHAIGAYDGGGMVGFCLAIPGLKAGGKAYLHSHMLGVLPEYHNLGVGRRLKLAQREDALARGIDLIEWTFDPLEIKNAFFNMERLGAIVRRYVENQYGTTTSPLHGGLPTDRCVAEWWVASDRVNRVLAKEPLEPGEIVDRIAVPADIAKIRREDSKAARGIQRSIGERFQRHFAGGLAVIGFERTPEAGVYLIGKADLR